VNPHLQDLHPYPFEKLRALFEGIVTPRRSVADPPVHRRAPACDARLHPPGPGGQPRRPRQLPDHPGLRRAAPVHRRLAGTPLRPARVNAATQVLPVNGSREALFAFAQCVIDGSRPDALVMCPNPFYQIYEGAAYLAGAQPYFVNNLPDDRFASDFAAVPEADWQRVQLVYVCSPGNPTGRVLSLDEWKQLFDLSDRYGFVIAADECYSEIYFDDAHLPIGGLEAAHRLGRSDFRNVVMFSSLSKRSNVPGMRSGFVAGDAAILKRFLLYRTYHGCAMSPTVQAASAAAWNDEAHVAENRRLYREKFDVITPMIAAHLDVELPDAGFYLWAGWIGSGFPIPSSPAACRPNIM
jgi:N-succinyldiaminopimelate aminotransferase